MNTTIIYEFPLNERIRIFTRLEQLFHQFNHHVVGKTVFDRYAAISVLLDIISIFKRNDLKSEVLKELERQSGILNKISQNQEVNTQKLQEIISQSSNMSQKLYALTGKVGSHLVDNDLFQSLSQRCSIPGGTCSFDLPEFHYWLAQNEIAFLRDLNDWSQPFIAIGEAIDFALSFIRNSHTMTQEIALEGFFQIALDVNLAHQLLRVSVDKSHHYFVEISGGKHRCTIRFMCPSSNNKRAVQSHEHVPFSLTRCIF